MSYRNIVVLTGAGISADSGIPVFRSELGLWNEHKVEKVATYEGFAQDPVLVHNFYNTMRQEVKTKEPNAAHLALTKLQKGVQAKGGQLSIITQNIDDLHERAGSSHIIHMHGELNSLLCEACGENTVFLANSSPESVCPHCARKTMRPDIVWFGEVPYHMDEIEKLLLSCDLFMSIGTSGVVYPAAGFVRIVSGRKGVPCIEFNIEKSAVNNHFTGAYYGKAAQVMPWFVDYLLEHDELPPAQA